MSADNDKDQESFELIEEESLKLNGTPPDKDQESFELMEESASLKAIPIGKDPNSSSLMEEEESVTFEPTSMDPNSIVLMEEEDSIALNRMPTGSKNPNDFTMLEAKGSDNIVSESRMRETNGGIVGSTANTTVFGKSKSEEKELPRKELARAAEVMYNVAREDLKERVSDPSHSLQIPNHPRGFLQVHRKKAETRDHGMEVNPEMKEEQKFLDEEAETENPKEIRRDTRMPSTDEINRSEIMMERQSLEEDVDSFSSQSTIKATSDSVPQLNGPSPKESWRTSKEVLSNQISALKSTIDFSKATSAELTNAKHAGEAMASAGQTIQEATKSMGQGVLDAMESGSSFISEDVNKLANQVKESIKDELTFAKEAVTGAKDALWGAVPSTTMNAMENARPTTEKLASAVSDKMSKFAKSVSHFNENSDGNPVRPGSESTEGTVHSSKPASIFQSSVVYSTELLHSAKNAASSTGEQVREGMKEIGKLAHEVARPFAEKLANGTELFAPGGAWQPTEPGLGAKAFADFNEGEITQVTGGAKVERGAQSEEGAVGRSSNKTMRASDGSDNNDISGKEFAHHVLEAFQENSGVNPEAGGGPMPIQNKVGLLEAVKKRFRSTIGIIMETLPPEFVDELIAEDAKGDDPQQNVGRELVNMVDDTQRRIDRAFGINSSPSSFPPPPKHSSSSAHGIASSITSSVQQMASHQDLLASSPTSAMYVGNNNQPSTPLESNDSPIETVEGVSSNNQPFMTVERWEIGDTDGVETLRGTNINVAGHWSEPSDYTADEKTLWGSIKGRALSILGVHDENDDSLERSSPSLEIDAEPQGNEIGGLDKVLILGSKDALKPGDGVSKTGPEMDEIRCRIQMIKRETYGDRSAEEDNGVLPQGNESANNFHVDSISARRAQFERDHAPSSKKTGWLPKVFSMKAKL